MAYRFFEVQREGHVVYCRFGNPPLHTLTNDGVAELAQIVAAIAGDASVRVAVFGGSDESVFIAHYELRDILDMADAVPADTSGLPLHAFHQVLLQIEALPCITVAALNGHAAGGGLELALACDFRLMRDGDFLVGLPETNVGIIPGGGGTQRLTRLLGEARALDLILFGTRFTPQQALDGGVIHRVLDNAGFHDEVRAFACKLENRAPIALREAKQAVRAVRDASLLEGLALEQQGLYRTLRTRDARAALAAWLSGKRVEFQGE